MRPDPHLGYVVLLTDQRSRHQNESSNDLLSRFLAVYNHVASKLRRPTFKST